MEAELFNAIKTRVESFNLGFNMIKIWNNQVEWSLEKDELGAPIYSINYPALFVEFTAPQEIAQLGNGVQIYDPLDIRIHICHNEIDSMDGNMEQNVNVFALKQQVFQALQFFEPDNACSFTRMNEEQDYAHPDLYHYIQTYRTNYTENTMAEPVGGILSPTDAELDVTAEFDESL